MSRFVRITRPGGSPMTDVARSAALHGPVAR